MKLSTMLFSILLTACGAAEKENQSTDLSDYSAENIQQILDDGEHTEAERAALEAQLNELREACADGDENACLELRELWAELESEREGGDDSDREDECEDGETVQRLEETYVCVDGEWVLQE